jgi:hypothetical protein
MIPDQNLGNTAKTAASLKIPLRTLSRKSKNTGCCESDLKD